MNRSIPILAATFLLIEGVSAQHSVTTDPEAHFRSLYDFTGVTTIYKLEADINKDGRKEIFLAPLERDVEDLSWFVYIAKPKGKYVLAGENSDDGTHNVVSFSKEYYWIGNIPEIRRYGLLSLTCGRGGQAECQLHAIVIDGDGFKDIPIGKRVNAEQNFDRLAKRFSTPVPPVQELKP